MNLGVDSFADPSSTNCSFHIGCPTHPGATCRKTVRRLGSSPETRRRHRWLPHPAGCSFDPAASLSVIRGCESQKTHPRILDPIGARPAVLAILDWNPVGPATLGHLAARDFFRFAKCSAAAGPSVPALADSAWSCVAPMVSKRAIARNDSASPVENFPQALCLHPEARDGVRNSSPRECGLPHYPALWCTEQRLNPTRNPASADAK